MWKTLLGTAVISLGLMWSTPSHAFEEEELIQAGEFCFDTDEAWIRDFTEILMTEGVDGYLRIMNAHDNNCYDIRIHGPDAVLALILKKKLWEFTPSGMTTPVEMWETEDLSGEVVYTWLRKKQVPGRGA